MCGGGGGKAVSWTLMSRRLQKGGGGGPFVTLLTSFIHPAGFNEEEAAVVFHEVDKDGWVGGWAGGLCCKHLKQSLGSPTRYP